MKATKFLGTMLIAAMAVLGLTACGSDDDSLATAKATITVDGTTFIGNYAYWVAEANDKDGTDYVIQLYSCDFDHLTDPFTVITILYHSQHGNTSTFATGEFTDFELSLTKLSSDESQDRDYYGYSQEFGNNATLTVSNSGGLTLNVSAMNYIKDRYSTTKYPGAAFSFTGPINKLPTKLK